MMTEPNRRRRFMEHRSFGVGRWVFGSLGEWLVPEIGRWVVASLGDWRSLFMVRLSGSREGSPAGRFAHGQSVSRERRSLEDGRQSERRPPLNPAPVSRFGGE